MFISVLLDTGAYVKLSDRQGRPIQCIAAGPCGCETEFLGSRTLGHIRQTLEELGINTSYGRHNSATGKYTLVIHWTRQPITSKPMVKAVSC